MAESKIEWTDRSDWNPIRGCTRVSPGCGGPGPHGGCYAEAMAARFSDPGMWGHGFAERTASGGRWTGRVELQADRVLAPLSWRKPAKIFVSSTSDVFHEKLSDGDIDRIFAVMALAPQHSFQILTKRPARMRAYLSARNGMGNSAICRAINDIPAGTGNRHGALEMPLPNVWLGVSVEDQERADERIPDLLATPAAIRFLSCEPLLGAVDLRKVAVPDAQAGKYAGHGYTFNALQREDDLTLFNAPAHIDWVIAGGESGRQARPMHPSWALSLRDQCAGAGVPFLFKQWGEWVTEHQSPLDIVLPGEARVPWCNSGGSGDQTSVYKVGKKAAGRMLDGRTHDEFPAERVPA